MTQTLGPYCNLEVYNTLCVYGIIERQKGKGSPLTRHIQKIPVSSYKQVHFVYPQMATHHCIKEILHSHKVLLWTSASRPVIALKGELMFRRVFNHMVILSILYSMPFLISGVEHDFTVTGLSEGAAQCMYNALGCFSQILAWTPDICPLLVDAPSQPWPRNSLKDEPRFSKHLTRPSAMSTALTLFNFKKAMNSSRMLPSLFTNPRQTGNCSILWQLQSARAEHNLFCLTSATILAKIMSWPTTRWCHSEILGKYKWHSSWPLVYWGG